MLFLAAVALIAVVLHLPSEQHALDFCDLQKKKIYHSTTSLLFEVLYDKVGEKTHMFRHESEVSESFRQITGDTV